MQEYKNYNLNDINSPFFNILREKIRTTSENISKNVEFLKNKSYEGKIYKNNEQQKFENVLELLKIARSGLIFHGRNSMTVNGTTISSELSDKNLFVYQPHYVLKNDNLKFDDPNSTSVEYYLPIIYPPNEDVMYNFCDFLNKKNFKYIWVLDKLDPFALDEQYKFGQFLSMPIQNYKNEPGENPICVVISPGHKEGYSFTFNPLLISLGLSDTAGDEEQIYGRVLRKYAIDALNGKYGKKIYQFFSGGRINTSVLPTLTSQYSLEEKTIFRGMYDVEGFDKSTQSWVGRLPAGWIGNLLTVHVFNGYDGFNWRSWVATDTSKKSLLKDVGYQSEPTNKEKLEQEFLAENFPILELKEEKQLTTLYNVKYVCLQFFKKIAEKENAMLNVTFGERINPINWFITKNKGFYPIDIQEMQKSSIKENPKTYCLENLKSNITSNEYYVMYKENEVLNLDSPIVCFNKGIECTNAPTGGSKKYQYKTINKKSYHKNKNKKTIKRKK
jgi:hypothetical protein